MACNVEMIPSVFSCKKGLVLKKFINDKKNINPLNATASAFKKSGLNRMRLLGCLFLLMALFVDTSLLARNEKPMRIVSSVPGPADMARELSEGIQSPKITIRSLATGQEDLHAVPARPDFLPVLNRADLLLSLGLSAEHAWLPPLLKASRNKNIIPGQAGYLEVSKGIQALHVPHHISRREGEQHPDGNPHFNVSPAYGPLMLSNIAKAMLNQLVKTGASAEASEQITENLKRLVLEYQKLSETLSQEGRSLSGTHIISYHEDVAYLAEFYHLHTIGTIEVKPGVPPTVNHLRQLKNQAQVHGVKLVLCSQAQDARLSQKFAEDIGARFVPIYNLVGGSSEVNDWESLHRENLRQLLGE